MTTIKLATNDQELLVVEKPLIATGDVNSVELQVEFDEIWKKYNGKEAVFFTQKKPEPIPMVLSNDRCIVPYECLCDVCTLHIGIRGVTDERVKTTTLVKLKLTEGTPTPTGAAEEPTPDVYQQILNNYGEMNKRLGNLLASETKDGEVIDMRVGADGVKYGTAGEAVRAQLKAITDKFAMNEKTVTLEESQIDKALYTFMVSSYGQDVSSLIAEDAKGYFLIVKEVQQNDIVKVSENVVFSDQNPYTDRIVFTDKNHAMTSVLFFDKIIFNDYEFRVPNDGYMYLTAGYTSEATDLFTIKNLVSYIPSPLTAKVGQMLVVESVDENGFPAAWKTVTPSSSGGGAGGIVWKGEWVANGYDGKGYKENDVVSYNGNLYIAQTDLTFEDPIHYGADWALFLPSGAVTAESIETALGYQPADKKNVDKLSREIVDLKGGDIPEYWKTHLAEKIEAIKNLHRQYGKDCFSFVHIADMHYPSNLGKNSPLLAKAIMDNAQIKYVICNGDLQTRGCHGSKELLLAENEQILELLKPILNKALIQKGNHDGAYGTFDKDGGGISNSNADGSIKPVEDRETYVYNLTPQEFHEYCYRKVGMVGNVHFDESGTAYYIDDPSNNVRYIGLNTQCNDYELNADGTQKYPTMWLMRFTQSQFDFLTNKALVGLEDDTKVVVFGHVPTTQEIGDRAVMNGVLKAFKDKGTYKGSYQGTAGGIAYTNKAEPLPTNTDDKTKWVADHRLSSSGVSAQSGKTVTNPIALVKGDVIRVKGVDFVASTDRLLLTAENSSAGAYCGGQADYVSALPNTNFEYSLVDGVHVFSYIGTNTAYTHVRFSFTTPTDASKVIITINEEIKETEQGYDAVEVDCDFANAKGKFVGYFHGHTHVDSLNTEYGFNIIGTRSDAREENTEALKNERVVGTITEQSFDIFTVTPKKIFATKIGAGADREINY